VNVNFALSQYTSPNSAVNATLRAPNAKVAELLNIARAAGVSAADDISGDGLLTLDVHAQGPTKNMSALVFSGTGKLQNATLKMASLTKPIQVRNADLGFSQNSATLSNLAASVGETNATGNLTMKNFAAPQVQFTLNADKVDVAELQQLTATTPAPQKRAAIEHSFWSIVPEAEAQTHPAPANQQSILNKMTGGGTATIGTVKYNDLLLSNVHSNITLDRGVVRLNPITADVYNGKETGNITIDLRPAQPVYTVALKTDKVDANKLVSSVSDLKQTLYGLLNSNVNATFSSTSANAIARSLNGQLALNLTNGKLMNVDLLHELASVGKFLGSSGVPGASRGFTNVAQLSGNFDVKNGLAQTNNLKATIDGGTLAAAGLVNLADQSLNMHVTAVLNKALSQQVGGTQIGGFMNTALANNQGELVIPVIVTGTFQHPAVAPDVEQLAQMKLKNLLPTSKNPGQLTTGIIGQILGSKNQGQNGGQQPQGGLSGILGAIGGKQKQQQPNSGVTGNEGQQTQPQPTPTPNPLGGILDKVLGGKKSPSPTPTPQK
jgi:AsmA protein